METSFQDMNSLSDYHWLLSDGLPPDDEHLPPFVPRILSFDQPSIQSNESTLLDTPPCLGQTESRVEASSPIFRSQSYVDESYAAYVGISSALPPSPSKQSCPSPSQINGVIPKPGGLKRRRDHSFEDFASKRRHPRSPVFCPTDTSKFEHFAPSPIYVASPTSQTAHSYKHNIESSQSSWHHSNESDSSKEVASLEETIHHDPSELIESRRCIKFLIQEMRKVIDSNRYGENSEITYQTIKRTEFRLKSFIETSHIMSQIVSSPDMIESYTSVNDFHTHNPFTCSCNASKVAPAIKYDPKCFLNLNNRTAHCYATPLDDTCDCGLRAAGYAVSSNSEINDTLPSNPMFSQLTFSNPMIKNNLPVHSSVDESPDCCWQETPSTFAQLEAPLYMTKFNQNYHGLVSNYQPIKYIYI